MTRVRYRQMQFLYKVTQLQRYLNHQGLSRAVSIDNESITPQTIQNWFKKLKAEEFNYFHSVLFEKLGLSGVFVLNDALPKPSPYCDAIWKLLNPHSLKPKYLVHYLVPTAQVDAFKVSIPQQAIVLNSSYTIYPPYHRTFEKHTHNFEKIDEEALALCLDRLKSYLNRLHTIDDERILKKEPLLLPVILESRKRNHSSTQIWKAIKDKLGERAWKYVRKRRLQVDTIGVKRVQEQIKLLNDQLNHIVQQIDIEYEPILESTIPVVLVVQYNTKAALLKLIKELAHKSARLIVYPNSTKAIVISNVQACGLRQVMNLAIEGVELKNMYFIDKQEDTHTFDYTRCFDPVRREWRPVAIA